MNWTSTWNVLAGLLVPLLLIFGLYHLFTWFNVFQINRRNYWSRVALVSAISHVLLITGFFVFAYFDYRADREFVSFGFSYGAFLVNRSDFWHLLAIFDTVPMLIIYGAVTIMDQFQISLPGLLPVTIGIAYVCGTAQWYFLGGGIGSLLERFWSGLKTGQEDEEWF